MQKTDLVAIAIIAAIILMGSGIWSLYKPQKNYVGNTESITIGVFPDFIDTPIYIADERGMFKANGLNVTIKNYETGLAASNATLKGAVDLAVMSEFVAAQKALQKENISIIANYDKSQRFYLVCRKNRGIENVSNLRGKKVGVAKGTIAEFYLGRFLELHGMNMGDVTLVDIKPSQSVNVFDTGNVDAIMGLQSDIDKIRQEQADGKVIWPAQSGQLTCNLVAGRNDWVVNHPELINRFLKSLDQASDYLSDHPAEAKAILQKRLNYDDLYIANTWQEHQFSLSLDQSLIIAMEDEARWMINNNLTTERIIPDFRKYIYTKGLEEVKPELVKIW